MPGLRLVEPGKQCVGGASRIERMALVVTRVEIGGT
jgi:hypothetical protein